MAEVTLHNERITGTTTNAYPTTAQYQNKRIGGMNDKAINIQNTDASNGLTYKTKVKPNIHSDYIDYPPGAAEVALAAGVDAILAVPEVYHEIAVELKSTVSDSHATFAVSMSARSRK